MDDISTTSSLQDGTIHPPFSRSSTSTTTPYFDAMPSMSSLFNGPRVQSRSSSPERGIKSIISAPTAKDPVQPIHISGHTNMGEGEDDKTTLKAGGSTRGDDGPASGAPQQSSPPNVKTETVVGISRHATDSPAPAHDGSPPVFFNKRSLSRSEDHNGGATDERSLRSVPVVYNENTIPEREDLVSKYSQSDVSRRVTMKRSPSKLVKRRSTKGKQTEYLANGHSLKGEAGASRRSVSRTSQRSFRSSRGPVFDMVTVPQNTTANDAGGAFGTGAVMAAPENEVEDELRDELQERLTIAERALTRKQTLKIHKEECMLMHSGFEYLSLTSLSLLFLV